MAKPKNGDITRAPQITADVVTEMSQWHNAKEIRALQTKLSGASKDLRSLSSTQLKAGSGLPGLLAQHLNADQRELLSQAAALLEDIRYNVEHAKERKVRAEKSAAKQRAERERLSKQLIAQHFQFLTQTPEQQIRVLELFITAHAAKLTWTFSGLDGLYDRLRDRITASPPKWATPGQWALSQVAGLIHDLRFEFEAFLADSREATPHQRLGLLNDKLAAAREVCLQTPEALEIIQIWREALCAAHAQKPPADPDTLRGDA